jgi:hypothetical protein
MRGHILILVENLSVPFDRRVWQESRALAAAGYQVTVICPQGTKQDTEREATIDGVPILRYPLRAAAGGPLGYLREYSLALWHTARLALNVQGGPYRRGALLQPAGPAVHRGAHVADSRRYAVGVRSARSRTRTVLSRFSSSASGPASRKHISRPQMEPRWCIPDFHHLLPRHSAAKNAYELRKSGLTRKRRGAGPGRSAPPHGAAQIVC